MNKRNICILILAAVTIGLGFTGNAQATETREELLNAASEYSAEQTLMAFDFSDDLSKIELELPPKSKFANTILGAKAKAAKSIHPRDDYIRGLKRVTEDEFWTMDTTGRLVASYIAANGSLPENGAQMFESIDSPAQMAELTNGDYITRLLTFGPSINMVSNGLYESFDDPNWHAGGVYFEMLEPTEDGKFIHNGKELDLGSPSCGSKSMIALYMKAFSAEKDHVLYDDYITYEYCGSGGCSGCGG